MFRSVVLRAAPGLVGLLLLLGSSLGVTAPVAAQPQPILIMRVLDAGLGDATWVSSSDGHNALINCGSPAYGERLVLLLQAAGVTHIDPLVVTDLRPDHIGGCIDVVRHIDVGGVLTPGYSSASTQNWQAFASATSGLPNYPWLGRQAIPWADDTSFTVLNPQAPSVAPAYDGEMLALEFDSTDPVTNATTRLLLADDFGQAVNSVSGPINVLRESSHISDGTLSSGLLGVATPRAILLSYARTSGARGPSDSTLAALRSAVPDPASFLTTADNGALAAIVDANGCRIVADRATSGSVSC